jgi:CRISPR-associated protein Csm5
MNSTTYHFTLRVETPLHIGCGESHEPTSFAVDEAEQELIIFNPTDFLVLLDGQESERYMEICRKGTVASLLEIYKFIKSHSGRIQGRRVSVSRAFINHYNKTLNLSPQQINKQLNQFEIKRTASRTVDSIPYIPGSAIKGALRTAVLNLRCRGQQLPGKVDHKGLSQHLLGGEFANDPFSLVKVSDFMPLPGVRQKIVYAVNKKKKLSEKPARGPYQILEAIEEGSEFSGSITMLDQKIRNHIKRPLSFDEIMESLSYFFTKEMGREQSSLKAIGYHGGEPAKPRGERQAPIRLGHHSGAESLTVEGHREILIRLGKKKSKTESQATTFWLAAGSERPQPNDILRPFGWGMISLLTEDRAAQLRQERVKTFAAWEEKNRALAEQAAEKAEAFATEQRSRELEELRLAEAKKLEEEEGKRYPWRKFLGKIDLVSNWGELKTDALEHDILAAYNTEHEVAMAVAGAAARVAGNMPKKWTEERDQIIADWLKPSGVTWIPQTAISEEQPDNETLAKIKSFSSPADYDRSLVLSELDIDCCRALKPLFKDWKWNTKKAKEGNQKLWKELQARMKKLTESER